MTDQTPLRALLHGLQSSPAAFPVPPPDFVRAPSQDPQQWLESVRRKRRQHNRAAERLWSAVERVTEEQLGEREGGSPLPVDVDPDPEVVTLDVITSPPWPRSLTNGLEGALIPESAPPLTGVPQEPITVEVHRPSAEQPRGAVLLLHGGGFWMGGQPLGPSRRLAAALAEKTAALVVDVDFRLAPEHRYATSVCDALMTLAWLRTRMQEMGLDPAKVVVLGESSGAHLASLVTRQAISTGQPLVGQVLVVPSLDLWELGPAHSTTLEAQERRISQLTAVFGHHGLDRMRRESPLVSPARAMDPEGLPPTLVLLGSDDEVVRGGQEFADRLREASVRVDVQTIERSHTVMTPRESRRQWELVAAWVRARLGIGPRR